MQKINVHLYVNYAFSCLLLNSCSCIYRGKKNPAIQKIYIISNRLCSEYQGKRIAKGGPGPGEMFLKLRWNTWLRQIK